MTEKFLKLPPEKQEKILQAICQEFTDHSYDEASTNRIIEKAGISKGTLFNYFGCKENMYHALLAYVLDFFKQYAIDDFETDDFIERCRILAENDIKIYQDAPYMIDFFARIYAADQSRIPTDVSEAISLLLSQAMEKLYAGLNYDLFREDVDATILMRIIRFTFDGYMQEIMMQLKMSGLMRETFETFMVDYKKILAEMKKIYYREEVLTNVG
ncbi:MAG: TetR/AcrR family transcriptional regulator [Turicibacter sp.]|nr:TetR/AcrR family transcriptional regulator [Turicibacter sp.]